MAAGRHTKYTPDMLPKILEIYVNGDTDSDVCAILGISRDTFYRWYKTKKAFSDTVNKGRLASEYWWNRLGKSLAAGTTIDPQTRQRIKCTGNGRVWNFIMINRFRQDYQNAPERQATTDSLDAIREAIQSALGGGK